MMSELSTVQQRPSEDIRRSALSTALRRRFALILLVAIVVTAAGAALALKSSRHYTATSTVLLRPLPGAAFSSDAGANAQITNVAVTTESKLVQAPPVVQAVNKQLGTALGSPTSSLAVTVPTNTETVRIQFTAGSAAAAQAGANAFASTFLAYRRSQASAFQSVQIQNLTKSTNAALAQLKTATAAAAKVDPPADAAANVQLYTSIVASLEQTISQAQSTSLAPGSVVAEAALPTSPTGFNPAIIIAVAAVLGLGIGLVVAIWRVHSDDSIRPSLSNSAAGLPIIASIPRNRRSRRLGQVQQQATDGVTNEYRRLRTNVLSVASAPRAILVSGARTGAGASEVAVNLGLSLAGAGYSVCVVDATLAGTGASELLNVGAALGLSDVVLGRAELDAVTIRVGDMSLVPAGSNPGSARELYGGERLGGILHQLRSGVNYVIVAAPSLSTPDGLGVGLGCDMAILVATERATTNSDVAGIRNAADRIGVPLIGLVTVASASGATRLATEQEQAATDVPASENDASAPEGTDSGTDSGTSDSATDDGAITTDADTPDDADKVASSDSRRRPR